MVLVELGSRLVEAEVVLEDGAADDIGQEVMAMEQAPTLGGALGELEHPGQRSDACRMFRPYYGSDWFPVR
jgi:hypothetical protein